MPRTDSRRPVVFLVAALLMVVAVADVDDAAAVAQHRDSTIVVELQHEPDSAMTLVLAAFVEAGIEVAVASAPQGLVLSEKERMGRRPPYAYAQFRADLIALGPITRVVLSGVVAPSEDLADAATVTSGSFFQGAIVWARLQWVGRELKKDTAPGDDQP